MIAEEVTGSRLPASVNLFKPLEQLDVRKVKGQAALAVASSWVSKEEVTEHEVMACLQVVVDTLVAVILTQTSLKGYF